MQENGEQWLLQAIGVLRFALTVGGFFVLLGHAENDQRRLFHRMCHGVQGASVHVVDVQPDAMSRLPQGLTDLIDQLFGLVIVTEHDVWRSVAGVRRRRSDGDGLSQLPEDAACRALDEFVRMDLRQLNEKGEVSILTMHERGTARVEGQKPQRLENRRHFLLGTKDLKE